MRVRWLMLAAALFWLLAFGASLRPAYPRLGLVASDASMSTLAFAVASAVPARDRTVVAGDPAVASAFGVRPVAGALDALIASAARRLSASGPEARPAPVVVVLAGPGAPAVPASSLLPLPPRTRVRLVNAQVREADVLDVIGYDVREASPGASPGELARWLRRDLRGAPRPGPWTALLGAAALVALVPAASWQVARRRRKVGLVVERGADEWELLSLAVGESKPLPEGYSVRLDPDGVRLYQPAGPARSLLLGEEADLPTGDPVRVTVVS